MYWCRRGISITVTGPDGCRTVQLSRPFARVGSRAGADLLLSHPAISGSAAYFHATDDALWCCSLARAETQPVRFVQIRPGAGVHLGPYRLRVEFGDAAHANGDKLVARDLSANIAKGVKLEFSAIDNTSSSDHTLERAFTVVGREPPSNVVLPDERLSRVHCLLYQHRNDVWVIDLLSSNGTRLGGRRVEAALLEPGRRVALGSHWLSHGNFRHCHSADEASQNPNERLILEQTIVREQREQIVTRFIQQGAAETRSDDLPGVRGQALAKDGVIDPGAELAPALDGPPPAATGSFSIALSQRAARRDISGPDARSAERLSQVAAPLDRAHVVKPVILKQYVEGRGPHRDAETSSRDREWGINPGRTAEAYPMTNDGAECTNGDVSVQRHEKVLDRLIDMNGRQSARAMRRTLMMAVATIAVISLAAIGYYVWGT